MLTESPDGSADGTSTVRCPQCGVANPAGAKVCKANPQCGSFLPANQAAKKHPVNVRRRQQLIEAVTEEFRPVSLIDKSTCEHLAGALEQLDRTRPGSMEWQRLVSAVQALRSTLSKPEAAAPAPSALPALDSMPVTLLEMLRDLLAKEEAGDALTEFERGQLSLLKMAAERRVRIPWPALERIQ